MNKKIILSLGIMICLASLVFAVSVGQILTQEQIDNINVSSNNLNFIWTDSIQDLKTECKNVNTCYSGWYLETIGKNYIINETTKMRYWDGNYIVINRTGDFKIKPERYINVASEFNNSVAKRLLIDDLDNYEKKVIEREKKRIKKLQTEAVYDLTNILNEINY